MNAQRVCRCIDCGLVRLEPEGVDCTRPRWRESYCWAPAVWNAPRFDWYLGPRAWAD